MELINQSTMEVNELGVNETVNLLNETGDFFFCPPGYVFEQRFSLLVWPVITFTTAATVLNGLFAKILWDFTVYHINLRLLLLHHCTMVIWMCIGMLTLSSYVFIVLYTVSDPCSRLARVEWACGFVSWAAVAQPAAAFSLTSLGVGVERMYGLLRFRTYHKRSKRYVWVSVLIILIVNWIPTVVQKLYTLMSRDGGDRNESSLMAIWRVSGGELDGSRDAGNWTGRVTGERLGGCLDVFILNGNGGTISLFVHGCLQIVSGCLWVLLFIASKRLLIQISINRAKQSLAARFQLSQNFGVLRTLSPWLAVHSAFHVVIIITQWLIVDSKLFTLKPEHWLIVFSMMNTTQAVNCLCFPLICVSRNKVLRKRLLSNGASILKLFKAKRRPNSVQPDPTFRGLKAGKRSSHVDGFQLNEIKHISGSVIHDYNHRKRNDKLQRIHVFSTLE